MYQAERTRATSIFHSLLNQDIHARLLRAASLGYRPDLALIESLAIHQSIYADSNRTDTFLGEEVITQLITATGRHTSFLLIDNNTQYKHNLLSCIANVLSECRVWLIRHGHVDMVQQELETAVLLFNIATGNHRAA